MDALTAWLTPALLLSPFAWLRVDRRRLRFD